MAFFEDLGKKISDTVDVVGKKTNEVVEVQKLRSQMHTLEQNIEKNYIALGKRMLAKYQDGAELTEEEKDLCEEIVGNTVLLDEYEKEIAELKGLKMCPHCGAPSPMDVAFCAKCGARLDD